jgi:hypothetical protein
MDLAVKVLKFRLPESMNLLSFSLPKTAQGRSDLFRCTADS